MLLHHTSTSHRDSFLPIQVVALMGILMPTSCWGPGLYRHLSVNSPLGSFLQASKPILGFPMVSDRELGKISV